MSREYSVETTQTIRGWTVSYTSLHGDHLDCREIDAETAYIIDAAVEYGKQQAQKMMREALRL